MIGLLEWGFVAVNVLGAAAWIYFRSRKYPIPLMGYLYFVLYTFHVGMGLFFFDHVLTYGGDSLFYWNVPWYFSLDYTSWIELYGYGNYFIQTVNSPLVWSGVGYFGGTCLYNLMSFAAIGLIYEKAIEILNRKGDGNSLPILISFAVCMSPGLHFWTGGVSKESFLILAFGLVFHYSGRAELGFLLLGFLGFLLALHVRLVAGFLLAAPFVWMLNANRKVSGVIRLVFTSITAFLFFRGMRFMQVLVEVDEISLESIDRVSTHQLGQLENLHAKSQIPLAEMGFPERIVAIVFRPFPWESWDIYSMVFALENMFLLSVLLLGASFIIKRKSKIPMRLLGFFVMAMGMILIYSLTLNNFGIIYRMKSIFLPFLLLPFIWAIYDKLVDKGSLVR